MILYNPTHFSGPLVCRIRQVSLYIYILLNLFSSWVCSQYLLLDFKQLPITQAMLAVFPVEFYIDDNILLTNPYFILSAYSTTNSLLSQYLLGLGLW